MVKVNKSYGYLINVHGYISASQSLDGGAFLTPFYSGSQFLSYIQTHLNGGARAVLIDRIEFLNITTMGGPQEGPDPLAQEIIDLFAQNSGDYTPTEAEKENINEGVSRILKMARAGITEV